MSEPNDINLIWNWILPKKYDCVNVMIILMSEPNDINLIWNWILPKKYDCVNVMIILNYFLLLKINKLFIWHMFDLF